jgi:hypothetical protein
VLKHTRAWSRTRVDAYKGADANKSAGACKDEDAHKGVDVYKGADANKRADACKGAEAQKGGGNQEKSMKTRGLPATLKGANACRWKIVCRMSHAGR